MVYSYEDPYTNPPGDEAGALAWVRERWAAFAGLSSGIIDLQHRAALAKQAYDSRGQATQAAAARLIIEELAKLQRVHHSILTWAESAGAAVGLGAVQIPLGIAGITIVALLVAWAFRKYETQEEALELLEAGILTPEQFQELDILDPPGISADVGGIAGGIGKWILFGILAWALLERARRGPLLQNPPVFLLGNPPGRMSGNVLFVAYEHDEDGEAYIHEFTGGVEMEALPDGSIHLSHPDLEIWRDF